MSFRFYSNLVSQASRRAAGAIFIVGLLLVGFGLLIIALPKLFATLAAMVFFVAGISCAATAIRIFLAINRAEKLDGEFGDDEGRRNVRIRIEQH
jgi:protein-S-isoprenylcysteine O-methyltransferase Ste14